ncbi:hypothetical protein M911_01700 [Ectothiorhodospira haloalkaliphila]|uniref:Uncharacterized protein n=1 Tax=Ectothiorhodospira haloalkaliphila TaxID=421628 RepID=W8KYE6_9GAMM|nr:hypothetical protein M911_01700 [Ectothiorhodospira haloalkaliphila]
MGVWHGFFYEMYMFEMFRSFFYPPKTAIMLCQAIQCSCESRGCFGDADGMMRYLDRDGMRIQIVLQSLQGSQVPFSGGAGQAKQLRGPAASAGYPEEVGFW